MKAVVHGRKSKGEGKMDISNTMCMKEIEKF